MRLSPTCDWLTVNQEHEPHEPFAVEWVERQNLETGLITRHPAWRQVRHGKGGQFQIKSNGLRIEVSGNPSHWGVKHNVFGKQIEESMQIVNKMLCSQGLPQFTREPKSGTYGARISRIDIACDVKTGGPAEKRAALCWHQTQEYPRLKKSKYGTTTYFGKDSTSKTIKIYDKGEEYNAKNKDPDQELVEYCESNGVVRYEFTLLKAVNRAGIRHWGQLEAEAIAAIAAKEMQIVMPEEGIEAKKLEPDERLATLKQKTQLVYHAYFAGADLREMFSESAWYRHRSDILEATGVDIADDSRIVAMPMPKPVPIMMEPATKEDFESWLAEKRKKKA